ncbi:MAG: hypothetical protein ACREA2_22170 [Blastocatellia bacterium]
MNIHLHPRLTATDSEQPKSFNELTPEEFDQLLACAASPELHNLAVEDFFTALAAIDAEAPRETVELTAMVKNGKLIFLEPAPLHAHDNEIQLGSQRVIITLVPETVGQLSQ